MNKKPTFPGKSVFGKNALLIPAALQTDLCRSAGGDRGCGLWIFGEAVPGRAACIDDGGAVVEDY